MTCQWTQQEIGGVKGWTTGCGAQFLPPGPPKTVGYNFCPNCGREIEVLK